MESHDGLTLTGENWRTGKKSVPVPLPTKNSPWSDPGENLVLRGEADDFLNHGTAKVAYNTKREDEQMTSALPVHFIRTYKMPGRNIAWGSEPDTEVESRSQPSWGANERSCESQRQPSLSLRFYIFSSSVFIQVINHAFILFYTIFLHR
jgi:hypothetical protein